MCPHHGSLIYLLGAVVGANKDVLAMEKGEYPRELFHCVYKWCYQKVMRYMFNWDFSRVGSFF